MESSKLKLNPDKTGLIIIGPKQQRNRDISHFPVKLLGSDTFPSDTVRNLGVVFDSEFNFRQHISQVCKSCFYHIRDLRRIRRHISYLLIELILSCQLLHIVLYLHNNHPTWLDSCIFQISTGSSDNQFHNLLCLTQNLTWANVLSLSLRQGSRMNSPSL